MIISDRPLITVVEKDGKNFVAAEIPGIDIAERCITAVVVPGRSREEICAHLGLKSVTYAMQTHVQPFIDAGLIKMSLPDKPKSSKQRYYSS